MEKERIFAYKPGIEKKLDRIWEGKVTNIDYNTVATLYFQTTHRVIKSSEANEEQVYIVLYLLNKTFIW